jgi:cell division protein ZapE
MSINPSKLYKAKVNAGLLHPDPEQDKVIAAFQRLYTDLVEGAAAKPSFVEKIFKLGKKSTPIKGIYIYGDVGRGKSMLMDLFYESLPASIGKRRVHFHAFMIEAHDYFHSRRESDDYSEGVDGLIPSLAAVITARCKVLCFDEFHVTDVADAMILGRLFTALFERGVVVVSTSNWPPDRLYEGGLQRERFLPFIELLKAHMEVVYLDSPTDYRAQFLRKEGCYFWPLGENTKKKADEVFAKISLQALPHREILKVKGRNIIVNRVANGVARFTFNQLCEQPHGAEDYLTIAREFHTVFLEGVPVMNYDRRNEAKRLMVLVDSLYECGTKLVVTAEAPPEKLYVGHDHSFEFQRTVSRLLEMQNL